MKGLLLVTMSWCGHTAPVAKLTVAPQLKASRGFRMVIVIISMLQVIQGHMTVRQRV
jgi:hypothetical protein